MNQHVVIFEVGKFYRVPCVRGSWLGVADWYPVLGALHEDSEHINFPYWHYHVDSRFLSQRQCRRAANYYRQDRGCIEVLVRRFPLMIHECTRKQFRREDHPKPVMRKRKCARERFSPRVADNAPWNNGLESAYADKKLAHGHCPHRGADLSTMRPDSVGCIECPLHGLIFHAETGRMVPRAEWRRMLGETT